MVPGEFLEMAGKDTLSAYQCLGRSRDITELTREKNTNENEKE